MKRCWSDPAAGSRRGEKGAAGEWHMVAAFGDFPMWRGWRRITGRRRGLLQGVSRVFTCRGASFLFGCTSMWYLYSQQAGRDDGDRRPAGAYDGGVQPALPEITAQARRSCTGGSPVRTGTLRRGGDLCPPGGAFVRAGAKRQRHYGAALLLGINAIYQTDMLTLQKAVEYLEEKAQGYPFLQGTAINRCMVETVRGYLLA
ncbi:MAG: hypothetical protein ACLU9S_23595 [Oscillospiraceae bacterium]